MLLGTLGASVLGNKVSWELEDIIIWIIWIKSFSFAPSFKQYWTSFKQYRDISIYKYFKDNYEKRNGSLHFRLKKNRWNKKLSFKRHKT